MSHDPIRDAITRACLQTGVDLLAKEQEQEDDDGPSGPFDFYHADPIVPKGEELEKTIAELARSANISLEAARRVYARSRNCQIAKSSKYQVAVFTDCENGFDVPMVHLSIKRLDREPIHDWRDLQQIKNAICGEEAEAIELYPAESRLVDAANQYHLFCIAPGERFPVGFSEKRLVSEDSVIGSKQKPFASPDALLPSRAQFSDVLRQLLTQIDLGGSIPCGLLNEARAMVNQVEHARQILPKQRIPDDQPPGIHCDCWDAGEPCCHCDYSGKNGNCDGDTEKHPCKAQGEQR